MPLSVWLAVASMLQSSIFLEAPKVDENGIFETNLTGSDVFILSRSWSIVSENLGFDYSEIENYEIMAYLDHGLYCYYLRAIDFEISSFNYNVCANSSGGVVSVLRGHEFLDLSDW